MNNGHINKVTPKRKKEIFLENLRKSMGIISTAAKKSNVDLHWLYREIDKDPKLREDMKQVAESVIDFAETKLYKLIDEGNVAATIFFLKCRAKKRGYIEQDKVQIDMTVTQKEFNFNVRGIEDGEDQKKIDGLDIKFLEEGNDQGRTEQK